MSFLGVLTMKKIFEEVTKEVVPKVIQSIEKGQKFISSILNKVDFDLTKTIEILKGKQEKIKQFVQDKETLLREIEKKEFEVKQLREQISYFKNHYPSEQLDYLRLELNQKLDDLLHTQRNYDELEAKIENEQKKVETLLTEKQTLEFDRNSIKSKYERTKATLVENESKTVQLEKELQKLQEKQYQYETLLQNSISKEEIKKYVQEIQHIQQEYEVKILEQNHLLEENEQIQLEKKEIEQSLLQKMLEITKISNELNGVTQALSNRNKEKTALKAKLKKSQKELAQSKFQIASLEEEMKLLKEAEAEVDQRYQAALLETEKARASLVQNYNEFTNEMASYEERIQRLQNELVDKQNEIAIAKAENGEADDLSEEEQKIMEREFAPRFQILYKNCEFHPEFLKDFYRITPSDRLKAEVVIMNLNYHFDITMTNVRPHPIKTKKTTILEHPFGTDSVGRIYFNKENQRVHLYRLSRTKNGRGKLTQENVIEWLKVNS